MARLLLSLVLLFAFGYAYAQKDIYHTPLRKIIPSAQLPQGVKPMHSNNNIDLTLYNGRYYIAFRTAPTHFASKKTRIYVISSTDMSSWRLEQDIFLGADMREPRFLTLNGKLILYFFEGAPRCSSLSPTMYG